MWLPLAGTAGRAPRLKCPSFVKIAYIATALERMMLRIGLGPSVRWGFTPTAVSNHLVAVGDLPFLKIPYTATTLEKTAIRMDQGPSVRWVQLVRWGFTPADVYSRCQSDIKLNRYHWQARPSTGWFPRAYHYQKSLPKKGCQKGLCQKCLLSKMPVSKMPAVKNACVKNACHFAI